MSTGNDLLNSAGKGTPWAKFPSVGTVVTGTIVEEPTARQTRSFEDGTPQAWSDGTPKMEVAVRVSTALRDPDVDDDDGIRQIVLPVKTEIFRAVQNAMKEAGVKALEVGGTLTVKHTATHPHPTNKRFNPVKEYAATYAPPAAEASGLDALAALLQ